MSDPDTVHKYYRPSLCAPELTYCAGRRPPMGEHITFVWRTVTCQACLDRRVLHRVPVHPITVAALAAGEGT